VPWRLFRDREPVSKSPGVYILAYFEERPKKGFFARIRG